MSMKKLNRKEYDKILAECREISIKKANDYGADVLEVFGEKGAVVRMSDKMHRLLNLIWHQTKPKVNDEKVEDTTKDLINYAAYLIMINRGKLTE